MSGRGPSASRGRRKCSASRSDKSDGRPRTRDRSVKRSPKTSEKSTPPIGVVRLDADQTLIRIVGGWKIRNDDIIVRVKDAIVKGGVVRATLTIRDREGICFRDKANLTSASSRARLLKTIREHGVEVAEAVLLALDEACRQPRPAKVNPKGAHIRLDVSDAPPISLGQLKRIFSKRLLITDDAYLDVFVGVVLAHRLPGDPVWLLIVAPPGATKTELLRTLYGYPGVFPLSSLTARTLASGLDVPEGDQSLLARLSNEILVLKDFTTVLEMHREERQAVLAQLREVYDGQFDKVWGTGRELHWKGNLGFVAGVTPVIDQHHGAMAVLGERFVLFRTDVPDRHALGLRALEIAGDEARMRRELARAMHGFLNGRGRSEPTISQEVNEVLAGAADFISRARSGVVRDGYSRSFEYAPPPEAPTRLAKVFAKLARGIALAFDHEKVGDSELQLVLRIALDSLPIARRIVIDALYDVKKRQTIDAITLAVEGFSRSLVHRTLEDLEALQIILKYRSNEPRGPNTWKLRKRWRSVLDRMGVRVTPQCPPDVSEEPTRAVVGPDDQRGRR